MIIALARNEDCTGCGVCGAACPIGCITMRPDYEGFLIPVVDETRCARCGKCMNACPCLNPDGLFNSGETLSYAAYCKNDDIRKQSSSGGIFSLLAQSVLMQSGVVVGAAFSDNFETVRHQCVVNPDMIGKLRGSKYLQSDVSGCYQDIGALLEDGYKVLFTGTPCQVAGLYRFLNGNPDNLYTQDIICHGCPSPGAWRQYLHEKMKNSGSQIERISFRNKDSGWRKYQICISFADGTQYRGTRSEDPFLRGFLNNLFLRSSCGCCKFKSLEGVSDITLGDFWGIERVFPDMDDNRGASAVLVHTDKGRALWQSILENMEWRSTAPEDIIRNNPSLVKSCVLHKRRDDYAGISRETADFSKNVACVLHKTYLERCGIFLRRSARFAKRKLRAILGQSPKGYVNSDAKNR